VAQVTGGSSVSNEEKQSPYPADDDQNKIDRDPVFYYSREHRLSKASPAVRALNNGKPLRPSLSKTLFATKANTLVFITLVVVIVFSLGARFAGRTRERSVILGGNTLKLAILSVEETKILELLKNAPKSGEVYVGEVDIAVSPVMPKLKGGEAAEPPKIFTHRIVFQPVDPETFYVSLPFEGSDFFVLLRTPDEQKSVRLNVAESKAKQLF
jgi:hypothetical protein